MSDNDTASSHFVMLVKDVFQFEDGRTVFAGEVAAAGPSYITPCDCELLVRNTSVAKFRIEEEMLPLKQLHSDLRSVSTKEKVDVDLLRRLKGGFKLRSV